MIRLYEPEDREKILRLREAHDPDLFFSDPDVWPTHSTMVVEEDGKFIAALSGRMCVEGFLMVDKSIPPIRRWRAIRALVRQGLPFIHLATGVHEAHVCVPRSLEGYASLLEKQPGFYKEDRVRLMVNLGELNDGAKD